MPVHCGVPVNPVLHPMRLDQRVPNGEGVFRAADGGLDRRVAVLGLGFAVAAPRARARPRTGAPARVGVLKFVSHAALDADDRGFEEGLSSAGWREGIELVLIRRDAGADPGRAAAIARRFVEEDVDLVHAIATGAAQAMLQTGSRIPMVFSSVTDPLAAGLVPRDSRPGSSTGTHVTGVSDPWPVPLQMRTYRRFVPATRTWGTIYNPAEVNSVTHVRQMQQAAQALGLVLLEERIDRSDAVAAAAERLADRVQAFAITSDNTTVANLEALVAVCTRRRIPLFAGDVDSVTRGAVAAYGMDYHLVGYAAGKKAALVLDGLPPGRIPWGPVEKFSLAINLPAARAQGLVVSAELLAQADRVLR